MSRTPLAELPPLPDPLPVPAVDSHTHLDTTAALSELTPEANVARAAEVGVTHLIDVGVDVESSRSAAAHARTFDNVWAAVALHPNDAARMAGGAMSDALAEIALLAELPEVRAVGETGLDYFRTRGEVEQAIQADSFRAHIEIARSVGKALVIHDRDAHEGVFEVLSDVPVPDRVVFHCFSGDAAMARECARRGWYVSFAGVVTFRNARDLQAAALEVPDELLLVETDAPYLTPTPHRGQRNAPYLLPHTVRFLAQLRDQSLERVCDQVTANAAAVFGPL